jgi:hypothetical protein
VSTLDQRGVEPRHEVGLAVDRARDTTAQLGRAHFEHRLQHLVDRVGATIAVTAASSKRALARRRTPFSDPRLLGDANLDERASSSWAGHHEDRPPSSWYYAGASVMAVTDPHIEASRFADHADETGAPCTRHPAIAPASLYQLAMVGSRAPAFHHDCASKLQGLVMALDELTELTENGDPQLIRAVETALEASRELNALLNLNRTLTRPAARTVIALDELVTRAAERVGVALRGAPPAGVMVNVGVATMIHALSLAIDAAAGTGRGRTLAITTTPGGTPVADAVELALQSSPLQAPSAGEAVAIAGFVIARDGGGRLWCTSSGDQMVIRLPVG